MYILINVDLLYRYVSIYIDWACGGKWREERVARKVFVCDRQQAPPLAFAAFLGARGLE
jgi:hypothetical protein